MRSPCRVLHFVSAAIAGVWAIRAAGELAVRSPFLPAAPAAISTAEAVQKLELRGIAETSEGVMFSIFDVEKKAGDWVRLGEAGKSFVVKEHDAARDTVLVEQAGRVFPLVLRSAKVASANYPAPPSVAVQSAFSQTGIPDEARRQEAVSNEVSRRLAVRAQASSPSRQL